MPGSSCHVAGQCLSGDSAWARSASGEDAGQKSIFALPPSPLATSLVLPRSSPRASAGCVCCICSAPKQKRSPGAVLRRGSAVLSSPWSYQSDTRASGAFCMLLVAAVSGVSWRMRMSHCDLDLMFNPFPLQQIAATCNQGLRARYLHVKGSRSFHPES